MICKNAILAAVSFVRHYDYIVIRIDRFCTWFVKLLNKRKDKAWVAFQFLHKVIPACSNKLCRFCLTKQATVFKRITNLGIQFFTVSKNHKRWRTFKFSAHFLRKEHHRITLAWALCMPKYPQFPVIQFPCGIRFHCFIYTEILMVTGKNFSCISAGMVI